MADDVSVGPLTDALWGRPDPGGPPAVAREWHEKLREPGQYVLLWGGVVKRRADVVSWLSLHTHCGEPRPADGRVRNTPATSVERMLAPLAHEGRIRIMQALAEGPLAAGALSEATGFRGGALYHHLRELKYAAYVTDERGQYCLTQLGHQLLVTMTCLAGQVISDEDERGLAVASGWDAGG
jgi:DNA-binding transcriptional ArsR family regulator